MRPTGSKTATEKSWPSLACSLYAVLWTVVPTSTAMDCRPPQMTASVMGSTRGALMNPALPSRGGWRSRPPMLPRRGAPPPFRCLPPESVAPAKPAVERRGDDSSGWLHFDEEGGVVVHPCFLGGGLRPPSHAPPPSPGGRGRPRGRGVGAPPVFVAP